MPIAVESRGNETFYKNGCLIWNHEYGLAGVLNLYYKRYNLPIDLYYFERIRNRFLMNQFQNRKNFEKKVKSRFMRKKSFEANQMRDRNDELCYRPEHEEFLRTLSLEDKLDWAETQHSNKKNEKKRISDSKVGDENLFCKTRLSK